MIDSISRGKTKIIMQNHYAIVQYWIQIKWNTVVKLLRLKCAYPYNVKLLTIPSWRKSLSFFHKSHDYLLLLRSLKIYSNTDEFLCTSQQTTCSIFVRRNISANKMPVILQKLWKLKQQFLKNYGTGLNTPESIPLLLVNVTGFTQCLFK